MAKTGPALIIYPPLPALTSFFFAVFYFILFFFFLAKLHDLQDLSPQLGIELRSLAVEAQSSNHWTTKEFPVFLSGYSIPHSFWEPSLLDVDVPSTKTLLPRVYFQLSHFCSL